jgi:hypothetical protein
LIGAELLKVDMSHRGHAKKQRKEIVRALTESMAVWLGQRAWRNRTPLLSDERAWHKFEALCATQTSSSDQFPIMSLLVNPRDLLDPSFPT